MPAREEPCRADWFNPAVKREEEGGSLTELGKCGTAALEVPGGLRTFPEFWSMAGRVQQETDGYGGSCYKRIAAAWPECWFQKEGARPRKYSQSKKYVAFC